MLVECETYVNAKKLAEEKGLNIPTVQEFKRLHCTECRPLEGNCMNEDKAKSPSFQRIVKFFDRLAVSQQKASGR